MVSKQNHPRLSLDMLEVRAYKLLNDDPKKHDNDTLLWAKRSLQLIQDVRTLEARLDESRLARKENR